MMNKIIKDLKTYILDMCLIGGLSTILKLIWDKLEMTFDGGVQTSNADTVIAIVLIVILWSYIRKWIVIKEDKINDRIQITKNSK